MKALLSICLFWGLLSPALPMSCYHCFGDDCEDPKALECEAGKDACVSAVVKTTQLSFMMPEFRVHFMQCSPASFCMNNYGSITTADGGTSSLAVQCCYTKLCNKINVSMPETKDLTANGIQCPSCWAFNSMECMEMDNLTCTGGETKCFGTGVNISIGFLQMDFSIYMQGCATPNLCFVPFLNAESSPDKVKIEFTERHCSDGDYYV